jgi:hypothetical protein
MKIGTDYLYLNLDRFSSVPVSIFDSVIILCALLSKKNGMKGNIIANNPSKILAVQGFNFDLNFDLTEFYPWKLYNLSDKKSVEVVLKNKKVKPENALNQSVYFSVNAETLNIEDYYVRENSTIKSFNYKTSELKHNYLDITTLPDYDSLENKKIAEFLKEKTPHYGFLYLDPPESDKNDIKKMLLAYSFSSELHKKYYDTLKMSHLIKRSLSLVGNSN